MKRDRGFTLVELMTAIVLGAIVVISASAILIWFTKTGVYLKKRIDYDRAWVIANEHLKKHVHASSYVKINTAPNGSLSLSLYGYYDNLTGTYSNSANGLYFDTDKVTFEGVAASFIQQAATKNKTTEIQVNYTAPFSNTLFLRCDVGMPNTWAVVIGSSTNDYSFTQAVGDLKQTSDKGYIILGTTDVALPNWPPKACLIKLDNYGNYKWSVKIAGVAGGNMVGTSVTELLDQTGQCAGYLVTCDNVSPNYNVLLKFSSLGVLLWAECTDEWNNGVPIVHSLKSAMQSFTSRTTYQSDGYVFTGGDQNNAYIPLCKINASGMWSGGVLEGLQNGNSNPPGQWPSCWARSIQQDFDAAGNPGYIIAGTDGLWGSSSNQYVCVIRTDSSGGVPPTSWARKITGTPTNYNYANYAKQVFDNAGNPNGYIIGGFTGSGANLPLNGYALRLDNSGNSRWSSSFPNGGTSENFRITPTADRGFIAGNVVGSNSQITKLNDNNIIVMPTKNLATPASATALCWQETVSLSGAADGYIAIGTSTVSAYAPYPRSIFVMKTDVSGNCPEATNPTTVTITPSVCSVGQPPKNGYIIQATIPTPKVNYYPH